MLLVEVAHVDGAVVGQVVEVARISGWQQLDCDVTTVAEGLQAAAHQLSQVGSGPTPTHGRSVADAEPVAGVM